MKNTSLFFAITLLLTCSVAWAQEKNETHFPMIGEDAPSFVAQSTVGEIKFPGDFFSKWKIIFSHPADFTPVCSSEILELARLQDEFQKLNTAIMVISTDGISSHIEWVSSLENIEYKQGPKVKINFPLIADDHLEISRKYGMIHPNYSSKKAIRGVFIIDPSNKIQAIFFYPASTGRQFDEIKRTLLALQESEKSPVFTPANWKPGDDVMLPAPASKTEADKLSQKNDPKLYNYTWYMWFKKTK